MPGSRLTHGGVSEAKFLSPRNFASKLNLDELEGQQWKGGTPTTRTSKLASGKHGQGPHRAHRPPNSGESHYGSLPAKQAQRRSIRTSARPLVSTSNPNSPDLGVLRDEKSDEKREFYSLHGVVRRSIDPEEAYQPSPDLGALLLHSPEGSSEPEESEREYSHDSSEESEESKEYRPRTQPPSPQRDRANDGAWISRSLRLDLEFDLDLNVSLDESDGGVEPPLALPLTPLNAREILPQEQKRENARSENGERNGERQPVWSISNGPTTPPDRGTNERSIDPRSPLLVSAGKILNDSQPNRSTRERSALTLEPQRDSLRPHNNHYNVH
jgi:hypothetical protein